MFEIIKVFNKYPFLIAFLTQIVISPILISSSDRGWEVSSILVLIFSELWAMEVTEKKSRYAAERNKQADATRIALAAIMRKAQDDRKAHGDNQTDDTNYSREICITIQNTSTGEIRQADGRIVSKDVDLINFVTAIIHQHFEQEKQASSNS
jgi:hypothetical protein